MADSNEARSRRPGFIPALHEVDQEAQRCTDRIGLLARAAQQMLRTPTTNRIVDGIRLLDLIGDEAEAMGHFINSTAELNGRSHYLDDECNRLRAEIAHGLGGVHQSTGGAA